MVINDLLPGAPLFFWLFLFFSCSGGGGGGTIVHIEYRLYGVWCISSRRGIDADQAGTEVSIHGDLCNLTLSVLAIVQRAVKWECDQCGHKLSADINLNNHETNVQRRESIHVSKGLVSEILFDAGTLEHY